MLSYSYYWRADCKGVELMDKKKYRIKEEDTSKRKFLLRHNLRQQISNHVLKEIKDKIDKQNTEEDEIWLRLEREFDSDNPFLSKLPVLTGIPKSAIIRRISYIDTTYLTSRKGEVLQDLIDDCYRRFMLLDNLPREKTDLIVKFRALASKTELRSRIIQMLEERRFYVKLSEGLLCNNYCPLLEETALTICYIYSVLKNDISSKTTNYIGKVLIKRFHEHLYSVEKYIIDRKAAKTNFLDTQFIVSQRSATYFSYPAFKSAISKSHYNVTSLMYYTLGFVTYHTQSTKLLFTVVRAASRYPLPARYFLLKFLNCILQICRFEYQIKEIQNMVKILSKNDKEDQMPICYQLSKKCCNILRSLEWRPFKQAANKSPRNVSSSTVRQITSDKDTQYSELASKLLSVTASARTGDSSTASVEYKSTINLDSSDSPTDTFSDCNESIL